MDLLYCTGRLVTVSRRDGLFREEVFLMAFETQIDTYPPISYPIVAYPCSKTARAMYRKSQSKATALGPSTAFGGMAAIASNLLRI